MWIYIHRSRSVCMYVNMHYAFVYTNLYPICFVLHFINVYCILYTHVWKNRICITHTHTCACDMMPNDITLKRPNLGTFLHFLCALSRSSPRCLSPTTRSRRSLERCWSSNTCRSRKNQYLDDSFHQGLTWETKENLCKNQVPLDSNLAGILYIYFYKYPWNTYV